jgi:hypothetical protein
MRFCLSRGARPSRSPGWASRPAHGVIKMPSARRRRLRAGRPRSPRPQTPPPPLRAFSVNKFPRPPAGRPRAYGLISFAGSYSRFREPEGLRKMLPSKSVGGGWKSACKLINRARICRRLTYNHSDLLLAAIITTSMPADSHPASKLKSASDRMAMNNDFFTGDSLNRDFFTPSPIPSASSNPACLSRAPGWRPLF